MIINERCEEKMKRTNRTNTKNLTRTVLLLLLFSLALPIMTGCMGTLPLESEKNANVEADLKNNVVNAAALAAVEQDETENDVQKFAKALANMAASGEKTSKEEISLLADSYVQLCFLNWEYGMTVKLENGQLYLNDVSSRKDAYLYNKVEHVKDLELNLNESALAAWRYGDETVPEVLSQLKQKNECYLIGTENKDCKFGQLAVYFIDDAAYFLSFTEGGEVMRIHRAKVNSEE